MSVIKVYPKDDDSFEEYELHSLSYELKSTGVALVTFNTPKNLNALTRNQVWEMHLVLDHMARDPNVIVVVWTGSGRAFNSGADLKGNKDLFVPEHIQKAYKSRGMGPKGGNDVVMTNETKAFWRFPKPIVAAINGLAVGGAANMALMNYFDIIICSDKARFMWPFPKLGFTPELASSYMMPFSLGFARAKEILLLSDWVSAKEAKDMGLVNKVVPHENLMQVAMDTAERFLLLSPPAVQFAKKILNHHVEKQLDDILSKEQEIIIQSLMQTGGPLKIAKYTEEQKKKLESLKAKL